MTGPRDDHYRGKVGRAARVWVGDVGRDVDRDRRVPQRRGVDVVGDRRTVYGRVTWIVTIAAFEICPKLSDTV